MSMLCYVLGVSPEQIKTLRAKPALATDVVMAAMGVGDASPLGALQDALDLQKSWHILHYLFTGSIDDTRSAGAGLLSGEELGEDLGYGPASMPCPAAMGETVFARRSAITFRSCATTSSRRHESREGC